MSMMVHEGDERCRARSGERGEGEEGKASEKGSLVEREREEWKERKREDAGRASGAVLNLLWEI